MNKELVYWHPETGKVSHVPAGWDETLRIRHQSLLAQQGYLPVLNYKEPRTQMPFAYVTEKFEAVDGGARQTIVETPRKVRVSQEKLLRHPAIQARLGDLMEALVADAQLSYWWTSDLCYLRGSPMALRAMAVFGMTQEQMEQIVLACRG